MRGEVKKNRNSDGGRESGGHTRREGRFPKNLLLGWEAVGGRGGCGGSVRERTRFSRERKGDHASPRSFSGREAGPRDATSLSSDLIIGDCDA